MILPSLLSLLSLACAAPVDFSNSTKDISFNGTSLTGFSNGTLNGTSPISNAFRKDVATFCDKTPDIDYDNYAMADNYVIPEFTSTWVFTYTYEYVIDGTSAYYSSIPTWTYAPPSYAGFWPVSDWVNINIMDSIMSAMTYYPDQTVDNDDFYIKDRISSDMQKTSTDVQNNFDKGDLHPFVSPNADANAWRAQFAITAYNFEKSRGNSRTYWRDKAKDLINNKVANQWDNDKGGIKRSKNYRSTSATSLYFSVAAQLYDAGAGNNFLDDAKKAWNWLKTSKMRDSKGLFYDGLDKNDKITSDMYTINQGPVLSGLGYMYKITNDKTYIDEATKILDAVIDHMALRWVVYEPCDLESNNSVKKDGNSKNYCSSDEQYYKGAFLKHLTSFLRNAPSDVSDSYKYFVTYNVKAAHRATLNNKYHQYSNVWIYTEDTSDWKKLKYKNDGAANGAAFDAFVAGIEFANC